MVIFSVVVATPGRLSSLLEKMGNLKNWLKSLEVLIIDEADRFSDVEFRKRLDRLITIRFLKNFELKFDFLLILKLKFDFPQNFELTILFYTEF